jgi:hypothetical protein
MVHSAGLGWLIDAANLALLLDPMAMGGGCDMEAWCFGDVLSFTSWRGGTGCEI